jgi:hypothetical protein
MFSAVRRSLRPVETRLAGGLSDAGLPLFSFKNGFSEAARLR